jgi:hypothetical protein
VGQWLWDTTFVTDLLAILPSQRDFIRGAYANFWDFQQRWSQAKPEYAQGMVANFMAPDSGPPTFPEKTGSPFRLIHRHRCWLGVWSGCTRVIVIWSWFGSH